MSTALETSVSASETAQLARFAAALDAPLVAADDALWATLTPVQGLGRQFLRASSLLPVLHEAEPARVLSAAPVNFAALDALTQFLGVPVTIALCAREPLLAAIERVYRDQDATGAGLSLGGFDGDGGDGSGAGDDDLETLKALAEDAPVVRLVQTLLSRAVEARASDVHLEISQQRFRVRYRIDGVLFDMESPPRRLYLPAISHLKLRARMNIAERRLPQDGRLKMELGGRHIDMRVSTVPTVYGESMVIRLLDQGPGLMALESLGFPSDLRGLFEQAIEQPHGMILVTGPTGSGKTSTLYAALSRVNRPGNKIITVEDPVEYQIDGINQIQVKPQIDLTFASALRSIVRQDPDIIMVGEIRDRETAEISIQSALTGHLVFSTLHTNDSFGAPHRLMDMGVESYLIASSVVLILAQRLVRVICPQCKTSAPATEADKLFLAQEGFEVAPDALLSHGRGCAHCGNSGYVGRTGIYELLPMTTAIKEAIIKKLPAEGVRRVALAEGVQTMRADGIRKVLAGVTTLEELARVTRQEM
ncbi:MAG TPA: ATPase, T2SS/T4P/T4SS family [Burkholderiaceae bacterium]|jgi:general secretion pathway protein E|nr:ATPase, T2SS/T4P/T4SS family [Burkholderiaceae bacterium]